MVTLAIHFNGHVVLQKQDYFKLRNLFWYCIGNDNEPQKLNNPGFSTVLVFFLNTMFVSLFSLGKQMWMSLTLLFGGGMGRWHNKKQ